MTEMPKCIKCRMVLLKKHKDSVTFRCMFTFKIVDPNIERLCPIYDIVKKYPDLFVPYKIIPGDPDWMDRISESVNHEMENLRRRHKK